MVFDAGTQELIVDMANEMGPFAIVEGGAATRALSRALTEHLGAQA